MCSFGLDWDEDVFRTEIIEGWDGHSYSKKSYSPQVNRSLSSHGPSLWFYSRNTHSGSRRVLPLKDLWESRRNSHDSIKSLQTHLDLPAIQTRGNCVPTFAHLSIPSKQWFTISHRPTPWCFSPQCLCTSARKARVLSSLTNSYASFNTQPRHHFQEGYCLLPLESGASLPSCSDSLIYSPHYILIPHFYFSPSIDYTCPVANGGAIHLWIPSQPNV